MFEMIYTSAAICSLDDAEVNDLLYKARARNATLGITGVLLFDGDGFIQLLEGEKENVLKVFSLIERDRRHCNITTFHTGRIPTRVFPNWSMGYRTVEATTGTTKIHEALTGNEYQFASAKEETLGTRLLCLLQEFNYIKAVA